jgi:N-acetylneuraminic acid mutarotase
MLKTCVIILVILVAGSIRVTDTCPVLTLRTGEGMAYDSLNNRVVIYGGYLTNNPFEFLNGTWTYSFKENLWTRIMVAADPGPRGATAMAYSPDHKMILLFGGMNTQGRLDDTWTFDCMEERWTKIEPSNKPEGRGDSAMVYDSTKKKFILYGGWGNRSGLQSDTWVYDPDRKNWAEVNTQTNPGIMYGHSMVWDPNNERAILYGGHLNSPISHRYVENPWFFYPGNGTWVEHVLESRPMGRYWGAIGYNLGEMRLVYFGGSRGEGPMNETWALDFGSDSWSRLETEVSPSSRVISRMVFVPENGFLLFGGATSTSVGFNDTWVLSPDAGAWLELHPATANKNFDSSSSTQGIPGFPLVSMFAGVALLIMMKKMRARKPKILIYPPFFPLNLKLKRSTTTGEPPKSKVNFVFSFDNSLTLFVSTNPKEGKYDHNRKRSGDYETH